MWQQQEEEGVFILVVARQVNSSPTSHTLLRDGSIRASFGAGLLFLKKKELLEDS